jgi:hypothetical protein
MNAIRSLGDLPCVGSALVARALVNAGKSSTKGEAGTLASARLQLLLEMVSTIILSSIDCQMLNKLCCVPFFEWYLIYV